MTQKELIRKTCRSLGCDSARIVEFDQTPRMFLICEWNRRSEGEWFNQDGEPQNFDYVAGKCLASGDTIEDLWAGIQHYRKLLRISRIKDPMKRALRMLEAVQP